MTLIQDKQLQQPNLTYQSFEFVHYIQKCFFWSFRKLQNPLLILWTNTIILFLSPAAQLIFRSLAEIIFRACLFSQRRGILFDMLEIWEKISFFQLVCNSKAVSDISSSNKRSGLRIFKYRLKKPVKTVLSELSPWNLL